MLVHNLKKCGYLKLQSFNGRSGKKITLAAG